MTPSRAQPEPAYALGIDIGGTKIAGAILCDGVLLEEVRWKAHGGAVGAELIAQVAALAEDMRVHLPARSSAALGLSIAGLVDGDSGIVVNAARLGLVNEPLTIDLESGLGMKVAIDNDANCTLRAVLEAEPHGAGACVLFAIGTGLGGAVALNGVIERGANGLAAELGHMRGIGPARVLCVCGRMGCVETEVGGAAIARIAALTTASDDLGAADVVAAARRGEPWAAAIIEGVGESLAVSVSDIVTILDANTFYLGGSVGHAAGDLLVPAIVRRLPELIPFAENRRMPRVLSNSLGPTAAAIGAAYIAADRMVAY